MNLRFTTLATLALIASLSLPAQASAVFAVDGGGRVVPLGRARASLQRTPPAKEARALRHGDPDALKYMVAGPAEQLPALLEISSFAEDGRKLSALADVPLGELPCPMRVPAGWRCAATPAIRTTADDIDARHPLVADRSIVAALGGALVLRAGAELGRVRVTGPRSSAVERYRATMRFVLVRLAPGGALPLGDDEAGAIELVREGQWRASALWGGCGISFGPPAQARVEIVDPPPAHMLVVGCDHGLPASGGRLSLRVGAKAVSVAIDRGMLPSEAARRLAAAIRARGFDARLFDNPRSAAGAHGTTDVSVRTADGKLVALAQDGQVSSDATLNACIVHVNMEDGLQHFGDVDSAVGTGEERALIRAYDDRDPTTVDVFVVPGFALGGRIGESFIGSDASTIRNVVIIDRGGISSGGGSFTLPHEVGHVLLDDPGHPDDFGVDTPTRLMDADASDPTAFGPRRLGLDECARVVRQSGPGAPVQLLTPWPLAR